MLNISYFVIIKFSFLVLTLRRALIGILIIWLISILGNLPAIFITPPHDFVDCCQTVCVNGSDLWNTTLEQYFTPRNFNNESKVYYHVRDFIIILIPAVIVFVTSSIAYCIYKKSSIKSSFGLEVRLLLLPVIMTLTIGGYLLGQDVINWQPFPDQWWGLSWYISFSTDYTCFGTLTECSFQFLILFFNVKIRRNCYIILSCKPRVVNLAYIDGRNISHRVRQSPGTDMHQSHWTLY